MARLQKVWDLITALLVALAAAAWLSTSALDRVTTELITFFGIQAAVILPAMIFTAGILRPEGLSLPEAKRYQRALRSQMIFWITLLALDFSTVGSLILGKALSWHLIVTVPWTGWTVDASATLRGIMAFFGSLAVLRTVPFIRGVMSLQALNGELTQKAIQARDRAGIAEQDRLAAATPLSPPEGFGRVVSRH